MTKAESSWCTVVILYVISYNELLWTVISYNELQWVRMNCYELEWTVVSYNELQWTVVNIHKLLWTVMSYNELQWTHSSGSWNNRTTSTIRTEIKESRTRWFFYLNVLIELWWFQRMRIYSNTLYKIIRRDISCTSSLTFRARLRS